MYQFHVTKLKVTVRVHSVSTGPHFLLQNSLLDVEYMNHYSLVVIQRDVETNVPLVTDDIITHKAEK